MATQKGKLFQLAEDYNNYRNGSNNKKIPKQKNKKPTIRCKQFDEGVSANLSYNIQLYPEFQSDAYRQRVPSSQMSFIDDNSQAFYVEPFEAEDTIEVPFRELNETSEEKLDKVVKADDEIKEVQPNNQGAEIEEEEKKLEEIEQKLDQVVKEKGEEETTKDENKDQPVIVDGGIKLAEEGEDIEDKLEVVGSEKGQVYEVSDEEFANDIGSILKGQKLFDQDQKKMVKPEELKQMPTNQPRKEENPLQPQSLAPKDDLLDPNKNEHKIFEKIAQSMKYANSYDLGTIAMSEKFDLIDKEIERQEIDAVLTKHTTNKEEGSKGIPVLKEDKVPGILDSEVNDTMDPKAIIERYDPNVALNTNNGGRLIKAEQLQIGDLILSTAGATKVGEGLIAPDSITGVYIGNNKLIARGESGVLEEQSIQSLLIRQGLSVILRHQNITNDKAAIIAGTLSNLRSETEKNKPENWVKVNCPSINIHPDVCTTSESQDKCHSYAGKINLGTASNDSFTCPISIVKAFENNQLTFINSGISGIDENKTVEKDHNGQLKYFGHLEKNI